MREKEARRLSAAREKNAASGGASRDRPAPAFVKRVVEEERRTAGWQRIFPGITLSKVGATFPQVKLYSIQGGDKFGFGSYRGENRISMSGFHFG